MFTAYVAHFLTYLFHSLFQLSFTSPNTASVPRLLVSHPFLFHSITSNSTSPFDVRLRSIHPSCSQILSPSRYLSLLSSLLSFFHFLTNRHFLLLPTHSSTFTLLSVHASSIPSSSLFSPHISPPPPLSLSHHLHPPPLNSPSTKPSIIHA